MTPGTIRTTIVLERVAWIGAMLEELRRLPLDSEASFASDRRNPLAAESCLRRALEGLLDLGRHVLARGFADGTLEYKAVARRLVDHGVLPEDVGETLYRMAGYRNRLVHFYDEVGQAELYEICSTRLGDIEQVRDEIVGWLRRHRDRLDDAL